MLLSLDPEATRKFYHSMVDWTELMLTERSSSGLFYEMPLKLLPRAEKVKETLAAMLQVSQLTEELVDVYVITTLPRQAAEMSLAHLEATLAPGAGGPVEQQVAHSVSCGLRGEQGH